MRYTPRSVRKAEAWYVPGGDPAVWLHEIAAWNVRQASLQLLPVPVSQADRTPCGLLATTSGVPPENVSLRCMAFGRIAESLYLPVEARLEPDISARELKSLLRPDYRYVWHPAVGLVAFEPGDVLRVADLVWFRRASSRLWNSARPGVVLAPRLVSLVPEMTPTFEMILEEGQGDIGTRADDLSELPPSPGEPAPGLLGEASRRGRRMVAGMAKWIAKHAPSTANRPTWVDGIAGWAERQLSNVRTGLDAARQREIDRLMHMLHSDPDQGLKFALPVGGAGAAHRGRAAPGDRLVERSTNFHLGHLGGGDPADFWDIGRDYQQRLTARYRELANREIRLGRHRRAAYIFGELLGDLHAAANALVQGRHWREAAVLFRSRLNQPLEAARCLEQGGLWMEAIELYVEQMQFEKAGDLYLKLDQAEEAHEQFRRAVDKHRSGGDRLTAARLLENKLESLDEAIDELASGWPESFQAVQCLHELFRTYARTGRHAAARDRIIQFRDGIPPSRHRIELANLLADTATNYPDRTVEALAADCTRVVVSRQLPQSTRDDSQRLLSAVSRLVPEDRLLERDCRRFLPQPVLQVAQQPSAYNRAAPRLIRSFRLPGRDVNWRAVSACREGIFVAGIIEDQLVLTRCSWSKADRPGKAWGIGPGPPDASIILSADPWSPEFVLVHVIGGPLLVANRKFEPTDVCSFETTAGIVPGMSTGIVAASRTHYGTTWLLEWRNDHLTLVSAGRDGTPVSTQTIETFAHTEGHPEELNDGAFSASIHARGASVYVGVANRLTRYGKSRPDETIDVGQQITALAGSTPNTRVRIAAGLQRGGVIFWDSLTNGTGETFAADMAAPRICINRGGFLIAAGDGRCDVYSTQHQRLKLETRLSGIAERPIAVISESKIDEFAIVSESGEVMVYELP